MKKIITILTLLLMYSCNNDHQIIRQSHIYRVAYEKCTGEKDTITVQAYSPPHINNNRVAVPELYINLQGAPNIYNVCDMKILSID